MRYGTGALWDLCNSSIDPEFMDQADLVGCGAVGCGGVGCGVFWLKTFARYEKNEIATIKIAYCPNRQCHIDPVYNHPKNMMTSSNGNISALLALCEGNSSVTGEFPSHRSVTESFGVFFDLRLKIWLSKKSRRRCFETPSRPLWRHCNEIWEAWRFSYSYTSANVLRTAVKIWHVYEI